MSSEFNAERQVIAFSDVMEERGRQDAKWGEQNHPDFDPELEALRVRRAVDYGVCDESSARKWYEEAKAEGRLSWAHVLVEELSEAICSTNEANLRHELVQTAAVALAWIEAIDRRRSQ